MSFLSSFAIFFIMWWVILFAILPIGVVTQAESGKVVAGTEAGAPTHPNLFRKAVLTTLVTIVAFAAFYWLRVYSGITLDDFPFKPPSAL